LNGEICLKKTQWGFPLVSGQVYPGATGSGKIVQKVKTKAEEFDHDLMIVDSAAGIGCPVIASIAGCDFVVLVVEPTPSSFIDVKRILELVEHFSLPFGVVINKWNINPSITEELEKWCRNRLLGKISYDKIVISSIVDLTPVVTSNSKVTNEIKEIFTKLQSLL
jgi:MinD superfamily P-loop ATPase